VLSRAERLERDIEARQRLLELQSSQIEQLVRDADARLLVLLALVLASILVNLKALHDALVHAIRRKHSRRDIEAAVAEDPVSSESYSGAGPQAGVSAPALLGSESVVSGAVSGLEDSSVEKIACSESPGEPSIAASDVPGSIRSDSSAAVPSDRCVVPASSSASCVPSSLPVSSDSCSAAVSALYSDQSTVDAPVHSESSASAQTVPSVSTGSFQDEADLGIKASSDRTVSAPATFLVNSSDPSLPSVCAPVAFDVVTRDPHDNSSEDSSRCRRRPFGLSPSSPVFIPSSAASSSQCPQPAPPVPPVSFSPGPSAPLSAQSPIRSGPIGPLSRTAGGAAKLDAEHGSRAWDAQVSVEEDFFTCRDFSHAIGFNSDVSGARRSSRAGAKPRDDQVLPFSRMSWSFGFELPATLPPQ